MFDIYFRNKKILFLYFSAVFAVALLIVCFGWEIYGAVFFLLLCSVMLALTSELTIAMLPAILMSVFVTKCYDSSDIFIKFVWVALPFIASVIAHFILYRKKLRIGSSFYGICGVAVAVTIGGLGTLGANNYFTPVNLYYVFGLGAGMILFYLLVKSGVGSDSPRNVAYIMYLMGIFAAFCVIRFYIVDWDTFSETKHFIYFQSSNNLSTFLMIAMPFPLYFISKSRLHLISAIFMYICIIMAGSRGGLLMGSLEFIAILIFFAVINRKNTVNCVMLCSTVVLLLLCVIIFFPYIASLYRIKSCGVLDSYSLGNLFDRLKNCIIVPAEPRERLLPRMIVDFKRNPIFGSGLANPANFDIYSPKSGAMGWYHMWFAQVIGSMGIVGIIAYLYQLVTRIIIFFRNRTPINLVFISGYLGLFLMSQTNPGEFCPLPYAALAVTFFIFIEDRTTENSDVQDLYHKNKKAVS